MSIILEHIPYYRDIFKIPGVITDDILLIGLPDIEGRYKTDDFNFNNLKDYFAKKGINNISILDLFDKRANIQTDLNLPIPKKLYEKFKTVIDIGTIEHIFNTSQCLENYLRMVRVNGLLMIVTCVNGYYGHGLHVFNPQIFIETFQKNNFDIKYNKFITSTGIEVNNPEIKKNILIWIAAKKKKKTKKFVNPQQYYWKSIYNNGTSYMKRWQEKDTITNILSVKIGILKRFLINSLPMNIKSKIYH